jgi:hypothetical protein
MNLPRKALSTLGGILLAALLLAALAPRAARGVAAALVQITNTSADPVPVYDSSTRFQTDVCSQFGTIALAVNNCGANNSTSFVVPTVTSSGATVKRLIVDNVSGFCSSYNNPGLFIKAVRLNGNFVPDAVLNGVLPTGENAAHYVPIVAAPYSYTNNSDFGPPLGGIQETDYTYGEVTHFSFNPGDTVFLNITDFLNDAAGDQDLACLARIDGYLATQ